ncbi:MAG TPA: hypothetical protein VMR74_02410 [Gammaproteobacteria bacterium]|nr:hypothetical protein [Gammaproteobacteria bacterium]
MYSAVIAVVADEPKERDHYKELIPDGLGVVHTIVEVHSAD